MTTPPHPPALLRAWAAHSSQPLDRVSIIEPAFSQFKAGYEAQAAEMAWLELIEVNLRNRCDQLEKKRDNEMKQAQAFRATVAAALAGLLSRLSDAQWKYGELPGYPDGLNCAISETNATIAALGLQAAESEER